MALPSVFIFSTSSASEGIQALRVGPDFLDIDHLAHLRPVE